MNITIVHSVSLSFKSQKYTNQIPEKIYKWSFDNMLLHYIYSLQEREREVHLHQARETDDFFCRTFSPSSNSRRFQLWPAWTKSCWCHFLPNIIPCSSVQNNLKLIKNTSLSKWKVNHVRFNLRSRIFSQAEWKSLWSDILNSNRETGK